MTSDADAPEQVVVIRCPPGDTSAEVLAEELEGNGVVTEIREVPGIDGHDLQVEKLNHD